MTPVVYLNGTYLPADGPALAPTDRGFLLGEGLYETVRVVANRPLAFAAHVARLQQNVAALAIPLLVSQNALEEAVQDLLAHNGLTDARLRITVSAGPADGPPTLLIMAMPYVAPSPEAFAAGVAVVSSGVPHPRMAVKTLSHLAYVLVGREADAAGAYEGLFLEGDQWIEGSRTNLIGRIGRRLLVSDSPWALPGVTVSQLLQGAVANGWTVSRQPLRPALLTELDGLYLTNALIEVLPIATVDGQPVASAGPEAGALRNAYRQVVGLPLL